MNPREATLESRTEAPRQRPRPRHFDRPPNADEPFFPIALRGYDRQAVDDYVAHVSGLVEDLKTTRTEHSAVKEALERVGEETSSILQHAHQTAEEITSRSRAQAEQRVAQADREARQLRAAAESHARGLAADTEGVWRERAELLEEIRKLAETILDVADSAGERLPEPPGAVMPGVDAGEQADSGENAGFVPPPAPSAVDPAVAHADDDFVPPPPPPPGAVTTRPPPPADLPGSEAHAEYGPPPAASTIHAAGAAADGQPPRAHVDEQFVPPPDRTASTDQHTEQMDALEIDVEDDERGFRAFKRPDFSARRWPG